MSVFKRAGSPYYQVEFVCRGNRISRSTGTSSRRDAIAFEKQLRSQIAKEAKTSRPQTPLTLDQACGRYWIEHGKRLSDARNIQRYLRYIITYIDPETLLTDIGPATVTTFVTDMRAGGVGEISMNRTITTLQGIHNRAAKLWELPVRVIAWKPHKTRERARINWISEDQAKTLLEALPLPTRAIVLFMLQTGLRKREAFNLTWDKVHLDRGVVGITAKGGIEREVLLSEGAELVLASQPREGRYVFDTTNWRKRFDAAKVAAGLDTLRWHDLRHTFATWLGRSGAPLDVIRAQLNHSSISVTQKYRHVVSSEVQESLQRLPTLATNTGKIIPLKKR